MSEDERLRISNFIEHEFGIKMPLAKKSLLEGRLAKRLVACGIVDYGSYFNFVTRNPLGQDEYLFFADLVSTHETSFFREDKHFQYLEQVVLPALCRQDDRRSISVLSAACSTGEEAYTIAMVIDSALQQQRRSNVAFSVEGVDLSDQAVAVAKRGVYLVERAKTIPPVLRQRYLMLSKDHHKKLCRFVPELRQHLMFHAGNLLADAHLALARYDVIFCRNVLIYFDQANQRKAIHTLLNHLDSKALLFLGHSETMVSQSMPIRAVDHAVFQKTY